MLTAPPVQAEVRFKLARVGEAPEAKVAVSLEKSPGKGLGFGLGRSRAGDEIVSSVTAGSVADGKLVVGDRLVAINGEQVQGVPHRDVVGMIQRAAAVVELSLMRGAANQPAPPASSAAALAAQKREARRASAAQALQVPGTPPPSPPPRGEDDDDVEFSSGGEDDLLPDAAKPAPAAATLPSPEEDEFV